MHEDSASIAKSINNLHNVHDQIKSALESNQQLLETVIYTFKTRPNKISDKIMIPFKKISNFLMKKSKPKSDYYIIYIHI